MVEKKIDTRPSAVFFRLFLLASWMVVDCRAESTSIETDGTNDPWKVSQEDELVPTVFGRAIQQHPTVWRSRAAGVSSFDVTSGSADIEHCRESMSDFASDESADSGFVPTAENEWRPLETLQLFGGLEGSKQPQDFGVNANFGTRWAANWGIPLLANYGIGAQIGTSLNETDNAVQVFERVGASANRTQSFSTVGIFQRTETWRWGIAYDLLYESYYDRFTLGQWRGRVGYATSERDEFGVWGAVAQQRSRGNFLTIPVELCPLTQGSCYWQHQFSAGTRAMCWAGASEGHAQANLALGDLPRTGPQFVFGAELDVPLNAYFAIYGQANFVGPADSGTVDSFLGLSFYPGGRAMPAARSTFAPFQALANSTMFAVDLRRN